MPISRLEVAALKKTQKQWVNTFVKGLKAHGFRFEKAFNIFQGSVVCLHTVGRIEVSSKKIVEEIFDEAGEAIRIKFTAKLTEGCVYWVGEVQAKDYVNDRPTFITVDELYGAVYIQFSK